MKYISPETIDKVNAQCDFVSLASEYLTLERRGTEYWGKCPFHSEKTPSFHIVPEKQMYKCFSCGKGGTVISFYMEMEKLTFPEAVVQLAKKNGIEVIYEGNSNEADEKPNNRAEYVDLYNRIADTYKYFLTQTEYGKFALDYVLERGVTREMIEKFKLGYSPSDGKWLKNFLKSKNYSDEFLAQTGLFSKKYPDFSFFRDRLMFPIFDKRGDVVAFSARFLRGDSSKTGKYINTSETEHYKKGETLFGFNFAKNTIRQTKKVVICEGNFDVIAYHQAGVTDAVATCGTALTDNHIKMLRGFVDTVYLSFDSDEAGINATIKAILLCRKFDLAVKIVRLEGGKDPSDILNNFGKECLTSAVNNATIDSVFLLSVLSKRYDISSIDGKKQASIVFFEYVNVLNSDIQKQASLQDFCQAYNLDSEAVKADFKKFNSKNQETKSIKVEQKENNESRPVKLNAEIRAVLAMVSNMDSFSRVRQVLSVDDFEDEVAKDMFIALEECLREGAATIDSFLAHCNDKRVEGIVQNSIVLGEFEVGNFDDRNLEKTEVLEDCIRLIRRNSLERKRKKLQIQIRQNSARTLDSKQQITFLMEEIQAIDEEMKKLKDKQG